MDGDRTDGDTKLQWGHVIRGNIVDDARIGINGELTKGAVVDGNTVVFSSRMERAIYFDHLDNTIDPERVRATNNGMIQDIGSTAEPDVAAFEFGSGATWCSARGNPVSTGSFTSFANNGTLCAIGGIGEEAAGFGSVPTGIDRWEKIPVPMVENSDDGARWSYKADSGS